jgi:predicted ATPase
MPLVAVEYDRTAEVRVEELTMIHAIKIENFKNILEQVIEFDRLTVFVGANASGKTSVLEAIDLAVEAEPGNPIWSYRKNKECGWIYTRGGSGDLAITCATGGGQFTVKVSPPDRFLLPPEPLGEPGWKFNLTADDGNSPEVAQGSARPLVFLQLNAAQLAKPSYSETDHPRLESDGGGLASVLAFMALSDPDAFDEFMDHVKELLPQVKRIRFRKVPVQRSEIESITIGGDSGERRTIRTFQGEAILFDFKNASDVSAHTVSEGTLMILGLLTVLLGPDRPKVLLMDDIEHGLHPLAQVTLLGSIKKVMEKFPELQILATAHSPYLLDQLEPRQIRLMTTGIDGYSLCGRLEDHPQFAQWKDEMAPGELWSLFGEKWIAEKGAAR